MNDLLDKGTFCRLLEWQLRFDLNKSKSLEERKFCEQAKQYYVDKIGPTLTEKHRRKEEYGEENSTVSLQSGLFAAADVLVFKDGRQWV